jgi:dTDP-glucose pyrophosphorylase
MAAGLGSRYGGLKQMEPLDEFKHTMTDYALYDAKRAGFEQAVFVIGEHMESDFREAVGDRIAKRMDVRYAFQRLEDLPKGFEIPKGRARPWGTGHAVLAARKLVDGDFAAINADDFYGASAFKSLYDFLAANGQDATHAMVGYKIGNTLTENGSVARGVCRVKNGELLEITERTRIEPRPGGAAYLAADGRETFIDFDTIVSLNLWGFGRSMMAELESRFEAFLRSCEEPQKAEYYLPSVANALLKEGKAKIKVLPTGEKWFGVTYADDMPNVKAAIAELKAEGRYPEELWTVDS